MERGRGKEREEERGRERGRRGNEREGKREGSRMRGEEEGGPFQDVLWAFEILAFFGYFQLLNSHNLGSTNDRRLVLVSNIMFWNELSENKNQNFFWAPKNHFLA